MLDSMWMKLSYGTVETTEAVLLAVGANRMRVVVKGLKDATDLRLIKDQWISENGKVVDIEFLINATLDEVPEYRVLTARS